MVKNGKNETEIKNQKLKGREMHKQFDEIFQKRMDRKDFLKHVVMGVAVITGTAGVVKLLKPQQQVSNTQQQQPVAMGYGASAYGGNQAAQKS